MITITTESGGQYEFDTEQHLYRKSSTTRTSKVGLTPWRRCDLVQMFDEVSRETVKPAGIVPGKRLYISSTQFWNITSNVTKVETTA